MALPTLTGDQGSSTIATLHARYEAAFSEYNAIDRASSRLGDSEPDVSLRYRYARAMVVSDSETDALRRAILFQVPGGWVDAMILQYHIFVAQDLLASCDAPTDAQKAELETGIDTLFDFMAREIPANHGSIGEQFTRASTLVAERRRMRCGAVEA